MTLAILFAQLLLKEERPEMLKRPMPSFSVPLYENQDKNVTEKDLIGQVAVVNFFASWCLPCALEHGRLTTLKEEHGVPVFGIATNDDPEDIKKFLGKFGNPFVKIGVDLDSELSPLWGLSATPESFIIDAKGNIRYHHVGMIRPEHVDEIFMPVIEYLRKEEQTK